LHPNPRKNPFPIVYFSLYNKTHMRRIRHILRRVISHPKTPLFSVITGVILILLTAFFAFKGDPTSTEANGGTPTPQLGLVAGESTEVTPSEEPEEASDEADMTIRVSPTVVKITFTPTKTSTPAPTSQSSTNTPTPTHTSTPTPTPGAEQTATPTLTPTVTPTSTATVSPSAETPAP
jgi:hypothetical protein